MAQKSIVPKLLNILPDKKLKKTKLNFFKIWTRSSTIPNYLVGKTVLVHNGKEFRKVLITSKKVGFKFGAFSFTRKSFKKVILKKQIKKKN